MFIIDARTDKIEIGYCSIHIVRKINFRSIDLNYISSKVCMAKVLIVMHKTVFFFRGLLKFARSEY